MNHVVCLCIQRRDATLNYSKQPSYELGVLGYVVCTGAHPVIDFNVRGRVAYSADQLTPLPEAFPSQFKELLTSLVAFNPGTQRL
jgi:hypothetical protein